MPTLSEFSAAASLSVTAEELDTLSVSRLLYVSVELPKYSRLFPALVDSGSAINLIHKSIVSSLKIPVTPCVGPKVSLADGKTTLSCNSFVVLTFVLYVCWYPQAGHLLCFFYWGSGCDPRNALARKD